ncbi:MAG: TetR/AcrR family transcriptional regulator [Shimia sp.]|uniref:TetR/AcrR family transcriptional regulator n=1 Tax=Shimia sp. TaxID=1954381 RepID=UPI004057E023
MPKIVNHEERRQALAARAAEYFSQHGYGAVGMRAMATHLGVSKSALYHYFPTKETLFLAATEAMMAREIEIQVATEGNEAEQLRALVVAMKADFGAEMALVFDYLRGKSAEQVRQDQAMRTALQAYDDMVTAIVGETRARGVLAQLMGALLLDIMSGGEITAEQVAVPVECA